MTEPTVTTYSLWSLFRNCRKACEWRYRRDLVPIERDRNLTFGALVHECLMIWHREQDLELVLQHIDRACRDRAHDGRLRGDWHLARALMAGYATRYPKEDFKVVALEKQFEGEIINPETGAASRSFVLAGKVDGIIRIGQENFLLEHKTTAQLGGDYLERLWTDFQISLYAWYVEKTLGIPITGILYNILVKARLKQGQGETETEFDTRRKELLARSKTGRSAARRKVSESDGGFQGRLAAKYADPGMFHRETLFISRNQFSALQTELWELTQAFLGARRRGVFYQNTSFCFHFNRPCPYFPLCRSGGNPHLIESLYEKRPPHEELRIDPADDGEKPF
ncbi:MAG: PD-(D/E)XK nuclease family protein [Candidatus Eisenbacteria bacterium]